MKLSIWVHENRAMTSVELLVVIVIVALLIALVLPVVYQFHYHDGTQHSSCINCLKEDGLALQIWAGDNNGRWPQALSITNGGAQELLAAGSVAAYFEIMSNELSTPRILACPVDEQHSFASYFSNLTNTNISYFVNLNADQSQPQAIVFGDDNFMVEGIPIKSGVMNLWTNQSVAWTDKRHRLAGDMALFDGSVDQASNRGLIGLLATPGVATNVVVIP